MAPFSALSFVAIIIIIVIVVAAIIVVVIVAAIIKTDGFTSIINSFDFMIASATLVVTFDCFDKVTTNTTTIDAVNYFIEMIIDN